MLRNTILLFFILQFISFATNAQDQKNDFSLKTVVIDAGHGGKDPGTSMGTLKEKDIVLEVALLAGKLIKQQFPEVNVIYTRKDDVFIPLNDRAETANKNKADLFISIHVNYFKSANTNGAETYILGNHRSEENLKVAQLENSVILLEEDYTTRYEGFDPNSAESYIMFELIQNEFLEQSRLFAEKVQTNFTSIAKRRNRGVRQAGFLVLRKTTMPSILIELGFISNEKDKNYLMTTNGKQKMAQSIAEAFANYKNRIDDRSNVTAIPTPSPTPAEKEQLPTTKITSIAPLLKQGDWYAIQIMANSKPVSENDPLFRVKYPIYYLEENGWYKYYTGLTTNYAQLKKTQQELAQQIKGSFPVVFIQGKKEKFKKL